ncbi:MAG: helix-turn-helix domain-containing protein [Nitrospira sp.]|nr:helix-turn-helix domain-containing protein [Nitrospira sp.]
MLELPNKPTFRPGEIPHLLPISRASVYRLIDEGKIAPVDRINNKIVIPRASLVTLLRTE